MVTAAFGVATVLLVYQSGMRWGARHALLAAGLLAVLPLHVRYSHYVLTDTPATFFVTLTLLLVAGRRTKRDTLGGHSRWAGAAAGLAAATKYNGGIALMMPLLACWMTLPLRLAALEARSRSSRRAPAAFLLVFAPYTILALPEFLDSVRAAVARISGRRITPARVWLILSQVSRPACLRVAGAAAGRSAASASASCVSCAAPAASGGRSS